MKNIGLITSGIVTLSFACVLVAAQQPGREGGQGRGAPLVGEARGGRGGGGGNQQKADNLPAGLFTAKRFAMMPTQRHEWVDIPSGAVKLHTWISYPPGEDKAGVVILMAHEPGLDDWMRAAADQVAHDGFIAVAPDLLSGHGPGGGGTDAFAFPDDAVKASAKLTTNDALRAYKAARDYALKLTRANGKSASLGFSGGGTASYRFAADVPMLNAAVVFYGLAPPDDVLAKINAPVLALYGDLDTVVTPTVQATADTMKRLGKTFEMEVYPHAANFFLLYQDMAQNGAATNMAWPRAMAYLKQHLQ
jgi:carboxymethylenebutenolidase